MPTTRTHAIVRVSAACALTLTLGSAVTGNALASHESPSSAAPITTNTGATTPARPLPALLNAVTETIQGTRAASGACTYKSSLRLAPGEMAIREDELAVDPATCKVTVRRGTPADAPTAKRSTGGVGTAAIVGHSAGYNRSWVTDPVGATVNEVRTNVDWRWDGTSVGQATCWSSYWWLWESGWKKINDNQSCQYEAGQSRVHGSSFAHYLNDKFCAFVDTRVEYDRNHVWGHANGAITGDFNVRIWGGCSSWLSRHRQVVRTL